MGFKQHISRTWQMIEQQVNDVPFRPDNEAVGQVKTQNRRPKMGRLFSAFSTETLARGGGGIV